MEKYSRIKFVFTRSLDEAEGETLSSLMFEAGCSGISEESFPGSETGRTFFVYFEKDYVFTENSKLLYDSVKSAFPVQEIMPEHLDDQDWSKVWRRFFHKIPIGKKILITPPWEYDEKEPCDRIPVIIEPGMAFGTGTHETTQLCLEVMEGIDITNNTLLDLGIGSGILAIAAVKLGASKVVGIEIDKEAEENLILNLDINKTGAETEILITNGVEYLKSCKAEFDLILCNMLSRNFEPMMPFFARGLSTAKKDKPASVLLSGYLLTEENEMLSKMSAAGFKVSAQFKKGEWAAGLFNL